MAKVYVLRDKHGMARGILEKKTIDLLTDVDGGSMHWEARPSVSDPKGAVLTGWGGTITFYRGGNQAKEVTFRLIINISDYVRLEDE